MANYTSIYASGQAVDQALQRGEEAWTKINNGEVGGGKIEMLYNGTNITVDGAVVNFKQIVDYLTVDNKFTYLLYNNMAYLTTKIDTTSSLKQVVFESSHVDGGMGKIFTITVNSSDGVAIASINHTHVANENYSNKVSTIAENDKKSTVHYPSNKAVTDITDDLKEDLLELASDTVNKNSFDELSATVSILTEACGISWKNAEGTKETGRYYLRTSPNVPRSHATYISFTCETKGNKKAKITAGLPSGAKNISACLFLDENYSLVDHIGDGDNQSVNFDNVEVKIPTGTKYIRLVSQNSIYDNPTVAMEDVEFNYSDVEKLKKAFDYEVDLDVKNGLFDSSRNIIEERYGHVYSKYHLSANQTVNIKGVGINTAYRLWAYVSDETGEVVARCEFGTAGQDVKSLEDNYTATESGTLYINGDEEVKMPELKVVNVDNPYEYMDSKFTSLKDELVNEISAFELENIKRRILNVEKKNDFAWSEFDKPVFVFIQDDSNTHTIEFVNTFIDNNVPLGLASIPRNLRENPDRLEAVRNAVEHGGEVLAHYSGSPTEESPWDLWLKCTKTMKIELEDLGFNVRGLIRADSTEASTDKGETCCRLYFDYANDKMGKSTQFDLPRILLGSLGGYDGIVAKITADLQVNGLHGFGFHGNEITTENMTNIINLIKENGGVITTYSNVFDEYGSSILEERVKILENN